MIIHYSTVILYFTILGLLAVYCLHRYHILYLYYKYRKCVPDQLAPDAGGRLPPVTIQLPVYNEKYVVRRLLAAVTHLDYPRDLLEIQVLDDSTDDTSRIVRAHIDELRRNGHNITCIHRSERHGFKAGALQAGLAIARGELIAIFDADFVPQHDFLKRIVPFFTDSRIGMVQSKWDHINRGYCLLTMLQSFFLDAHFILEHTARNRSGRFFNFNGTAGVWRKECILSSGGWRHETLTEDLDLSYRAQLQGWKFVFLPEVVTPGEIPVDMNSFKTQQHRWAKGGIETARNILPLIFKSAQPLKVKIEAFFHLTGNANYLLIILLAFCSYPALLARIAMGWQPLFLIDLLFFIGTFIPVAVFYIAACRETSTGRKRDVLYIPFLLALGVGLAVNNGKAVVEALAGRQSSFVRTPKFHIEKKSDTWMHKTYRKTLHTAQLAAETALSVYVLGAIVCAVRHRVYAAIPFLLLFFTGFACVALASLYETATLRRNRTTNLQQKLSVKQPDDESSYATSTSNA